MSAATLSRPRVDVGRKLAELEALLARQRQALGRSCARGVPGAWDVLTAIYGEPVGPRRPADRVEAGA